MNQREIEEYGGQQVVLGASINPNNEETGYRFEYSTTEEHGKLTGTIATGPEAAPPGPLLPAEFNESGAGAHSILEELQARRAAPGRHDLLLPCPR